ncbi:response regulator [Achromobacter sp. GG226]|uniref:response regulator n=1 Tax=Verticiella alkaliphila TaxID=2779529 RepID=UPI001C0DD663|nr:response regulator [Verticiella sp. GG226]MBU4610700.1 response regulator [Verticiella sp. GG226]
MRLLVVEDEEDLANWLLRALAQSGFVPDHVSDIRSARASVAATEYDAIVLDLRLPDTHGLVWLRELREAGNATPVLVLTAQGGLDDRVRGLNLGADDFLTKPFALAELEARLSALGRRGRGVRSTRAQYGRLVFDSETRSFSLDGELLSLTPRERAALAALVQRFGKPMTKSQLFEKVFELQSDAGPDAIEVVMHRLRKKLADSGVQIHTVRGLGYLLKAGDERSADELASPGPSA